MTQIRQGDNSTNVTIGLDLKRDSEAQALREYEATSIAGFGQAEKTVFWAAVRPAVPLQRPVLIGSSAVEEFLKAVQGLERMEVFYDALGGFAKSPSGRIGVSVDREGMFAEGRVIYRNAPHVDFSPEIPDVIDAVFGRFSSLRNSLNMSGPTLVNAGLIGTKGLFLPFMTASPPAWLPKAKAFAEDAIFLQPLLKSDEPELLWVRKHIADFLWNAGGHRECGLFDDDGRRSR